MKQKATAFSGVIENLTLHLTQRNNAATSTSNETTIIQRPELNPKYNTHKDFSISINNELKLLLVKRLESMLVITPGKTCTEALYPIWLIRPSFGIYVGYN
jgi:hypothetical protein